MLEFWGRRILLLLGWGRIVLLLCVCCAWRRRVVLLLLLECGRRRGRRWVRLAAGRWRKVLLLRLLVWCVLEWYPENSVSCPRRVWLEKDAIMG